ncbi:nucleotidyltransferase family protein [Sulfitobacter sp. JB4-11]|uniref:nucleotidyltransferase family protein n=1 Tax=Sulfitobacter rhodophyticola TaxID=3238304 RepID=UPI00351383E2
MTYPITRTVPHDVAAALLLLSRQRLSEDDKGHARTLLGKLDDGHQLIDLAHQKLSLPFVARHLDALKPDWYHPSQLRDRLNEMTLLGLRVSGAQMNFHRKCIAPLKVQHSYFKGLALGAQYYDQNGLRPARDVDLIVDRKQIRAVIDRAREQNYALIDNARTQRILTSERDIDAALRYERVANLISPEGVLIEVHEEIDKHQGIFYGPKILWQAEAVSIKTVPMHSLPHAVHFIYVAYHCARHVWSALHWLADLDAMRNHPSFDHDTVMRTAQDMGMEPLVEATLDFIEGSKRLPDELDPGNSRTDALLELCVLNLEGGSSVEHALRAQHTKYALPFDWLVSPRLGRKILRNRLRGRFRPSFKDYEAVPLPPALRHIYPVIVPVRKLMRGRR